MDSQMFYAPSAGQSPRAPVARMTTTTPLADIGVQSLMSTRPIASVGTIGINTRPNVLQGSNQKDQNRIGVANIADPAPKGRPSGQQIRINDLIESRGNSVKVGNYSNSNSGDSDNDSDREFPTLERLPLHMEKKRILAGVEQNTSKGDEEANNRTRSGSPVSYSDSTSSSYKGPIWISDSESDTESQDTDYNDPANGDKGLADVQVMNSEAILSSLPAVNSDNGGNNSDDIVHKSQVQSSAGSHKSALFHRSSVSHQASELQQNTKITTDRAKHASHKGPNDLEDYIFDVFAEEDDSDGSNTQPKPPRDPAISSLNLNPNTRNSEPQNTQRATQSPGLTPGVAALPPAHRPRGISTRRRNLKNSVSSIKSTTGGNATSTSLEFLSTGESHLGKPITDPDNLWKARMVVNRRVQYCVEWEPTWHFESELEGMKVLLDEYDAELQNSQGQRKNECGKPGRKSVVTAPNKLWEGTIIGRRIIGGRRQYRVEWKPTWEPELKLANVKELIDEFMANRKTNQYRGEKRAQKRSWAGTEDLATWSQLEPSKRQRQAQNQ
ncbi:hypothetical protein BGZ60DRAFT_429379 [Tricladium varicosporioides]|nr:hypothetical protein BGZ60DRAFT_429379 [Hymenoscyphus varicosporioides]